MSEEHPLFKLIPGEPLSKPPLVEAIMDIRWRLDDHPYVQNVKYDPNYNFLVGRFQERAVKEYGFYEALPSLSFPEGMANYTPQHRFRKGEGRWPLIQLGPGLATLNDSKEYQWEDFSKRVDQMVKWLWEAYPNASEKLKIEALQLRYIDAFPFNFEKDNVLNFLNEQLKVGITLPKGFFDKFPVDEKPLSIINMIQFRTSKPRGALQIQFSRGKNRDEDALFWETILMTGGSDLPVMPDGFRDWLSDAHAVVHNLFFSFIEGPLKSRLK